ncbi:glycosyltransferase family 2 protein [Micromonospora sp. STR1s_5]|nr:glycosyltransferase family 2 protein [Micromonospora sp. STR1s_5]
MRIEVAVATAGRPDVLRDTARLLAHQERLPDALVISAPAVADAADLPETGIPTRVIVGARGSCVQRNRIITESLHSDVLLFLDDDFVLGTGYISQLEKLFQADPTLAVVSGEVLADGVLGPGLTIAEAEETLQRDRPPEGWGEVSSIRNGYGCNMAVRTSLLRDHGIRFDENLPLYGWLEDVDISRILAQHGRIVRATGLRGVHLGVKSGRQGGRRIGYSQVANPIYLARKGTLPWRDAMVQMSRNLAANLRGALWPEPFIDRRGRIQGHIIAARDLLRNRLHPTRITSL